MWLRLGILGLLVAAAVSCGVGRGTVTGPTDGGSDVDAGVDAGAPDSGVGEDAGPPDGGDVDAGSVTDDAGSVTDDAGTPDAGADDPCPNLPIPPTCYGKTVVYREWSPTATGDNTYFVSQAPWRLGFTRFHDTIWIVKFRLDANTYLARVTATGDTYGAAGWIASEPCSAASAVDAGTVAYGLTGVANLEFVAVRDAADLQEIRTNPAYASLNTYSPKLFGGRCYYFVYENADSPPTYPISESYLATVPDRCGVMNGTPDCYYLAIDMFHYLDNPVTGARVIGNVINGLTH